jgi:hypothetical protein
MRKTFSIMPDLRLFQPFATAHVNNGDDKNEGRCRYKNQILHKTLLNSEMSMSQNALGLPQRSGEKRLNAHHQAEETLSSKGLGSNERYLRIL